MDGNTRSVSSVLSVILLVAVTVVLGTTISIFALQIAETLYGPAPNADFEIEPRYFDDGIPKNDSVAITHVGGDRLERERLEVRVGDDVVYNATADSETTNTNYVVPGLVVEVDSGDFNDLNKPCRLNGQYVSPPHTCGGPAGDGDGSDDTVVLQWEENVTSGERIVIQERNHPNTYDVMQPGDSVKLIYRGDDFTALLAEETIEGESQ